MSADAGTVIGIIVAALAGLFLFISLKKAVFMVREKEAIVLERLGKFQALLTPGVHFVLPWIDRPKRYSFRYYISSGLGRTELVTKLGAYRIQTQNEVLDFPAQPVITRDNALICLDAVLNYKISNPRTMIYSTTNVPMMISKVLQAQIRNIAGSLDVDQLIEDTAAMDRVAGEVAAASTRWGVHIEFVKVQRVDAGELASVLAKRKNADLQNQEIIIHARAHKQTEIIQAEGRRDMLIKEAEGEAQQILARARGDAKAIINGANAEASSIREVSRAVARSGEDPSKYLLALKMCEALETIVSRPCSFAFMPEETSFVQVAKELAGSSVLLGGS